jgi:hypothetical protein
MHLVEAAERGVHDDRVAKRRVSLKSAHQRKGYYMLHTGRPNRNG